MLKWALASVLGSVSERALGSVSEWVLASVLE
jgi:hypothetical protein